MKRTTVVLNILSLITLVLFFELVQAREWNPQILIYETIPILVLIITYFRIYFQGRSWKKKNSTSYSIFSISIVSLLMIYHLLNLDLNMILIVSVLYLAHLVPAYLIPWNNPKRT